jgi:DNA-binding Lrp family transcriptional regulator
MSDIEGASSVLGAAHRADVGKTDVSTFFGVPLRLDHLDTLLYHELLANGRATMEEMAGVVGLSRVAVRARVTRLLESGTLRVVGIVHPSARGVRVYAHLSIHVRSSARDVGRTIASFETLPLVSIVAGRPGLIAEAHTQDMSTLESLLRDIRSMENVESVETAVYSERIKDLYAPPGIIPPTTIDDTDLAILRELEADGRISYADIARRVQFSSSTVRTRVHELIDRGVVRISTIMAPGVTGLQHMGGFGVRFHSGQETVGAIQAMTSVSYLSLTLSRFDAIGTLLVQSQADLVTELDRIRALPDVEGVESWTHLEVLKENNLLAAFATSG